MSHSIEPHTGRQDAATPFRPAGKGGRSYRVRAGNRVEVKLPNKGKAQTAYAIHAISTDLGGCAFRVCKLDGSGVNYDVQVGGGWDSCTCAGFCWTERPCRHMLAICTLLDLGVLQPAPASAAAADEDVA